MACGVAGIGILVLARVIQPPWLPYVYGIWLGLGYAVQGPMSSTVASDLFRGRNFGAIYGVLNIGSCLGGSSGAWVAGYLFDLAGDYFWALVLGMAAVLAALVSLWLAAPRKVRLVPGQAKSLLARRSGGLGVSPSSSPSQAK